SGNWDDGFGVGGYANVSLQDSTISGNWDDGFGVGGYANVSLVNSTVSGNGSEGLEVWDSANVSLQNSTVSGNGDGGLWMWGYANVSLTNSTISGNGHGGLSVGYSARVTIKGSTIEKNGTDENCAKADYICNGILVRWGSQTTIIDSIIRNNTDWGVAAYLKKCGYGDNVFTGKVIFQGNNQIYGNGKGNVCLP
ncbi:MAG: right-handed parallel beta-helix repeat-containing protein, partial [Candidatus Bipolaricaulia bacterium]